MKDWKDKYTDIYKPFFDFKNKLEKNTKPFKYDNVSDLAKKICNWMIDRRENGLGISIIGLCVELGISRPSFDNMKGHSVEFKELVEVSKACIEEYWVECLGSSESAARFILSAMNGYTTITKEIIESDNFIVNIKNPNKTE
jgi:hypothetical protein